MLYDFEVVFFQTDFKLGPQIVTLYCCWLSRSRRIVFTVRIKSYDVTHKVKRPNLLKCKVSTQTRKKKYRNLNFGVFEKEICARRWTYFASAAYIPTSYETFAFLLNSVWKINLSSHPMLVEHPSHSFCYHICLLRVTDSSTSPSRTSKVVHGSFVYFERNRSLISYLGLPDPLE